jgi:hypothetical protein
MDTNERQIALAVLENLEKTGLMRAPLNGSRVLDVADLRQYIYEQMSRIRTTAHVTDALYGNSNGRGKYIHRDRWIQPEFDTNGEPTSSCSFNGGCPPKTKAC